MSSRQEEAFRRLEAMAAAAAADESPVPMEMDSTPTDTTSTPPPAGESKTTESATGGPHTIVSADTIRPPPPSPDVCNTTRFQLVDWTVTTRSHLRQCETHEYPHHWSRPAETRFHRGSPIVLLFGTTDAGNSISLVVEGFRPYFDVELPSALETDGGYHADVTPELIRQTILDKAFPDEKHNDDLLRLSTRSSHRVFGFKFDGRGKPLNLNWARISCETVHVWRQALRTVRSKGFTSQIIRTSGGRGNCRRGRLVVAGDKLTFEQMFGNLTNIVPSGWVEATRLRPETSPALRTQMRYKCLIGNSRPTDNADVAPLVCASFDIECVPTTGTRFPCPERTNDLLAQIGISFGIVGRGVVWRMVICLGETSPVYLKDESGANSAGTPVEIISCATERDVLQTFTDVMIRTSPDIVMGYNIFGFDFRFMADKALRIEAFGDPELEGFEDVLRKWRLAKAAVREYEEAKEQSVTAMVERHSVLAGNPNSGDNVATRRVHAANAALSQIPFIRVRPIASWDRNPRMPSVPHVVRALCDYDTEEELREAYDYFRPMGREPGFTFNWCARINSRCKLDIVMLESAALGSNELFRFDMRGTCTFDVFLFVKSNVNMGSYKLKDVCAKFLPAGQNKVDLDYKTMFKHYQSGDPDLRAIVAEYCSMDCDLPIMICERTGWIGDIVEMSRVTFTSLPDLVTRGQQVKVYSQIGRYAQQWGFAMNHEHIPPPDGYAGATVLEPKKGYYREPIATLDFASLYPSIMQSHNLCFSTYILPHDRNRAARMVARGLLKIEKIQTGAGEHWFVHRSIFQGLLPRLLAHLLGARRAVKKIMKKEPDPRKKKLLDSKQKSLKVSCNSVYGFTGVKRGRMPCYPISSSTTSLGRKMIDDTKHAVETKYPGADVIYGDSVAPWTPVTIRVDGEVQVLLVGEFARQLGAAFDTRSDGKETCELPNVEVMSAAGWVKASRIIQHKLSKRILRVHTTSAGWVDVTEDHSMILSDGRAVAPSELKKGDRLLASSLSIALPSEPRDYPPIRVAVVKLLTRRESVLKTINVTLERDTRLAILMGAALRSLADDRFVFATTILSHAGVKRAANALHPEFNWKAIAGGIEGVASPSFQSAARELRQMYQTQALEYPAYLINGGSAGEIAEYLLCCMDELGDIRVRDACTATRLRILMERTEQHVSVSVQSGGMYVLHKTKDPVPITVTSVESAPHGDRLSINVYDFTVPGVEQFAAGIGICVHNTDSVMVKFPDCPPTMEGMKRCFALGEEAAAHVTDVTFGPWPEKVLEMEKASFPYILFKKKRYIARIFEKPDESAAEYDYKGVELKRRDNSLFLRKLYKKCLHGMVPLTGDALPKEQIVHQIRSAITEDMMRLVNNRVDIGDFIINKSLKKHYKNPNLPHVVLAEKMRKRIRDGDLVAEPPAAGDRIDYVVIEGKPKEKLCFRTEDPDWAREHNLKMDRLYYIRQQVEKPMLQLLEPFGGKMEDILASAEGEINRQRLGIKRIDSFFSSGNKRSSAEDAFEEAIRRSKPAAKKKKKGRKRNKEPPKTNPLARFFK